MVFAVYETTTKVIIAINSNISQRFVDDSITLIGVSEIAHTHTHIQRTKYAHKYAYGHIYTYVTNGPANQATHIYIHIECI